LREAGIQRVLEARQRPEKAVKAYLRDLAVPSNSSAAHQEGKLVGHLADQEQTGIGVSVP